MRPESGARMTERFWGGYEFDAACRILVPFSIFNPLRGCNSDKALPQSCSASPYE
jgi:hypothetical protein